MRVALAAIIRRCPFDPRGSTVSGRQTR